MKIRSIIGIVLSVVTLVACGLGKNGGSDVPKGGINLYTLEQDKELGKQVAAEIAAAPAEYPILDSATHTAAYKYIYGIRDKILATGKVEHKDDFVWQVRIINDDSTLNAFCTPGGYIYVYTGIIKYLENESQLAGVMGHEMGHADLRHSTRQMTKLYGIELLESIFIRNDREALKQITTAIIGLKFSREHETEADRMSVEYLCGTAWPADGGAGFFEKIEASGGSRTPEFLSTHPSPANRIENYHTWAKESNCAGSDQGITNYKRFQQLF